MTKRGNREGSIYRDKAARWRGAVKLPDGGRKYVTGRTRADVARKVREAHNLVEKGLPQVDGRVPTVRDWMAHYLSVSAQRVRPRTLEGYESKNRTLITPKLGHHKLTALQPEHIERWHADLVAAGLAPASILQAHRILSSALKMAMLRGKVARNVASLTTPPALRRSEVQPFTREEARVLLDTANGTRLEARWVLALSLGLRQGEALALQWHDIDLQARTLRVRQALQRHCWRHGCPNDQPCGKRAASCPQRHSGGLHFVEPKSRASGRTVVLPEQLASLLRAHRHAQRLEQAAAPRWEDHGLVFTETDGRPVDSSNDWARWRDLLTAAGLPHKRLHDARHTAASVMLAAGVPLRTIMELLGHSQLQLTSDTYAHIAPELREDAADRMSQALWG